MDTDLETMAMTATWFWNTQSAKHFYIGADNKPHWQLLSNTIQQEANGLHLASPAIQNDQPIFQNVSSGVATDINSYNKRWTSFQTISRSVLEGGNPYENIPAVLDRLGFVAKGQAGYQDKFGIAVKSPGLVKIDQNRLLLAQIASKQDNVFPQEISFQQFILESAQNAQDSEIGDNDMFLPTTVGMEFLAPMAAVVVADSGTNMNIGVASGVRTRALGVCEVLEANSEFLNPDFEQKDKLSPIYAAEDYFRMYEKSSILTPGSNISVTVLSKPSHGELKFVGNPESES